MPRSGHARYTPSRRLPLAAALSLLLIGAAVSGPTQADVKAQPSVLSSRIVRFVADPDNTYVLYLHPGMVTDVKLAPGETLQALALGDTVQWVTQQVTGTGDVFIKPVKPGIQTSATLVTSAHTYQLMLVARDKGDWYQEVRFTPRSPLVFAAQSALSAPSDSAPAPQHASQPGDEKKTRHKRHSPRDSGDRFANVDLQSLSFGWTVKGKASFAPMRVLSSPDFVWIKLPRHTQAPVVFARQNGQWSIVNYDFRGDWIVVQTQARRLQLRANGDSVEIDAPTVAKADSRSAADDASDVLGVPEGAGN